MMMRKAYNVLANLTAAQNLLKVPLSINLEKPRDLLHQLGTNLANAPLRTRWILYRYWANR